jgi:hypothetical protein
MTGADKAIEEQLVHTGDPWIDLRFRQAVLDGATADELTDFAHELQRGLPGPTPPPPAAMFIHADIAITLGLEGSIHAVDHCALEAMNNIGDRCSD